MELILFVLVICLICVVSFWVAGSLYGLVRRPAVYFPPSLAAKMAFGALTGMFALGFGGIAAATWVMNAEFQKRSDYNAVTCIVSALLISTICCALTVFSGYALAWEILG